MKKQLASMNEKSLLKIEAKHLECLKNIGLKDLDILLSKNPKYKSIKENLLSILLIQGAALHYVDKKNGIKDFDILLLFNNNGITVPYRRTQAYDCGMPEFGRYSKDDITRFQNRRVDVLMRSVDAKFMKDNLEDTLKYYFENYKSSSMNYWKQKAVVGIYPENIKGKIIIKNGN